MCDKNYRTLQKQFNKIIMSENKIRIDLNRHLCDSCKKMSCCDFPNAEYGENQNVVRCKKYVKRNDNKSKPRVQVGETYYTYTYINEKTPNLGFKVIPVVEKESRIDNLLHEVGSYFLTEADCLSEIKRLSK